MDQHKLRSLVFEKTGVKVDIDDPIFALVALNEAVLAEAVERHIALIDAVSQELMEQMQEQVRAAGCLPTPTAATSTASAHANQAAAQPGASAIASAASAAAASSRPLFTPREKRLLAAAAGISLLTALLVAGALSLFSKPALTPQQAAALVQGEKLAKAVERLDAKTREQIQASLNGAP